MLTDTVLLAFQVSTVVTPLVTVLGVASKVIAGCILELLCEDIDPPPHPIHAIKNKKTNMVMRGTNRISAASKIKMCSGSGNYMRGVIRSDDSARFVFIGT